MSETIDIPEKPPIVNRKKPECQDDPIFGCISDDDIIPPMPSLGEGYNVLVTGSTHDQKGFRHTRNGKIHRKLVHRLSDKINRNKEKITRVEENKSDSAEIGIISYGSVSRAVWELQKLAEIENIDIAHLRLITIWPFPDKEVRLFLNGLKHVIVPEQNSGLIVREIERCNDGATKVHSLSKIGGGEPIAPSEILDLVVSLS
jgi:2-oxoglutarate ferredoxin oxidoreductase subunit alpha